VYKLGFYVPASHLEVVKQACFAVGAGRIGNYDSCCWQTQGQGQFRPLEGSQPYIGQTGEVEAVPEYRVEMVCSDELARAVVEAMIEAHPYEEPAWDLVQLVTELPR
jgi:structural toxin protein (hemagglutinin/hemolysin) RtxA